MEPRIETWCQRVEEHVICFLADPVYVRSCLYADPPIKGVRYSWEEFALEVDELFADDQLDRVRGVIRSDVRRALTSLEQNIQSLRTKADRHYRRGYDKALLDDQAWKRLTTEANRLKALLAKQGWWF